MYFSFHLLLRIIANLPCQTITSIMTRNDHEDGQADESGFRSRRSRSWSMNSNNINNPQSHLNNYNNNNNSMSGTYHTNSNRHDTPPTRNNNNTSHYNPSASNPYP